MHDNRMLPLVPVCPSMQKTRLQNGAILGIGCVPSASEVSTCQTYPQIVLRSRFGASRRTAASARLTLRQRLRHKLRAQLLQFHPSLHVRTNHSSAQFRRRRRRLIPRGRNRHRRHGPCWRRRRDNRIVLTRAPSLQVPKVSLLLLLLLAHDPALSLPPKARGQFRHNEVSPVLSANRHLRPSQRPQPTSKLSSPSTTFATDLGTHVRSWDASACPPLSVTSNLHNPTGNLHTHGKPKNPTNEGANAASNPGGDRNPKSWLPRTRPHRASQRQRQQPGRRHESCIHSTTRLNPERSPPMSHHNLTSSLTRNTGNRNMGNRNIGNRVRE